MRRPRYLRPYGPTAYLLEWEQRIDPEISRSVIAYATAALRVTGVTECVPAYASLLVRFAPSRIDAYGMGDRLLTLPVTASVPVAGKRYELPVCYAPEFAPDGDWVGQVCRLGADELVELHTAVDYTVYFTGYRPGFSFLGPTHHRLRIGRRKSPRTAVPAGALGLADRQTGIYPTVSPGGWQLIGNCPLSMITAGGNARLEAGDRVRFVSISKDHHAALLHGETEWKTA